MQPRRYHMNKKFLCFLLIIPVLLFSFSADAKRRKRKKLRKWSVAASNGYTFHQRSSSMLGGKNLTAYDGQMKSYFSSLEVARNYGRYEVGSRLQFYEEAFVSPFVKLNFIKNYKRNALVPFLILGISPSSLAGAYFRLGLNLFFKRYFSLSPFLGAYFWYNVRDLDDYQKYNFHLNGGISLTVHL